MKNKEDFDKITLGINNTVCGYGLDSKYIFCIFVLQVRKLFRFSHTFWKNSQGKQSDLVSLNCYGNKNVDISCA